MLRSGLGWLARIKAQVAPSHTGGRADKGINAATRQLGIDRTDAQRAVKVDSLTPEAKQAARDAGLADNRTALQKASLTRV
jgi:ParB family chromosome partitioning protein